MKKAAKAGAINPKIRQLVANIFASQGVPAKAYRREAETLFYWVRDNIRYMRDVHNVETVYYPDKTLQLGAGDCDDMVTLLAAMLLTCGHPCRFVAIGKQRNVYTHVFIETKVGAHWVGMEPTEPWPFGQVAPGDWFTLRFHL